MAAESLKQELVTELEQAFGLEQDEGDRPVLSFREFVSTAYPRYQWYRHCEVLADALQRVADGDLRRMLVFMPPRAGKSLLTSKLFPGYYLYRHPERWVGINSYAAELAYTLSRASRDAYRGAGGQFKGDANAVKNWESNNGGGVWAAGVGGAITGKGYSLGLIDDPLKNSEEALSEKIRGKHKEWYGSTFYTRAEPDAAIVIVQTRWHQDDLSGWLLDEEKGGDEPERWHIVNFEAIKEESVPQFPKTCTLEPDWRSPGEALCPERFDIAKLNRIKPKIGSYFFSALYQQRPSPTDGNFKRGWWKFWRELPSHFDQVVQSWDCAFKETKSSDFVVGQVWGKLGGDYYLLDQIRDRMDINATLTAIRSMTAKHPQSKAKLVEDKANGPAVIDLLKREVSGMLPIEPEGGKVVRATAIAPYVEAGNVYLPDPAIAPWVHDFIEEFCSFPNGSNDDQVDCCSQALNWFGGHRGRKGIKRSGISIY